jgi:hypothetical protein
MLRSRYEALVDALSQTAVADAKRAYGQAGAQYGLPPHDPNLLGLLDYLVNKLTADSLLATDILRDIERRLGVVSLCERLALIQLVDQLCYVPALPVPPGPYHES